MGPPVGKSFLFLGAPAGHRSFGAPVGNIFPFFGTQIFLAGTQIILADTKIILAGIEIILAGTKIILAGGEIILAGGEIILTVFRIWVQKLFWQVGNYFSSFFRKY